MIVPLNSGRCSLDEAYDDDNGAFKRYAVLRCVLNYYIRMQ